MINSRYHGGWAAWISWVCFCVGCSSWHSAARLNLSTLTPLGPSCGCLCLHPPPPPLVLQLSAFWLWLRPRCHWRGRVNRPFRSPRISVRLECAVAPAPVGGHHSGGWRGGACLSRCWVRERGESCWCYAPRQPLWVAGGGWGQHGGTQRACGWASPQVTVPDHNHSRPLLIKWLSVVSSACSAAQTEAGKETPGGYGDGGVCPCHYLPLWTSTAHDTKGVAFLLLPVLKEVLYTPNRALQTLWSAIMHFRGIKYCWEEKAGAPRDHQRSINTLKHGDLPFVDILQALNTKQSCHIDSSFISVCREDDNSSKLLAVNMCVGPFMFICFYIYN